MENVFIALNARSKWEDITRAFKFPNITRHEGTIDNLRWFLTEGKNSNARRKNCKEAVELAEVILGTYSNYEKSKFNNLRQNP